MINTNVVFVWLCVNEWQLLQLMTVDTPDYCNSGGFYKISGTCLQQLDNICKYMYHTLFSHLILLIFIILVWPWSIWFYLWMASSGEGWPFILFWAVCVGCVLDRKTEAGFHWVHCGSHWENSSPLWNAVLCIGHSAVKLWKGRDRNLSLPSQSCSSLASVSWCSQLHLFLSFVLRGFILRTFLGILVSFILQYVHRITWSVQL